LKIISSWFLVAGWWPAGRQVAGCRLLVACCCWLLVAGCLLVLPIAYCPLLLLIKNEKPNQMVGFFEVLSDQG